MRFPRRTVSRLQPGLSKGTPGRCRRSRPGNREQRRPPRPERRRAADPAGRRKGLTRGHADRRGLIQPCSSHSPIAPASSRTNLAHPSIVWNAGRRSFISSIAITPVRKTNPWRAIPFRALTRERDSKSLGLGLFHLFRGPLRPQDPGGSDT
jgi:hypothetical protein